MKNKISVVLCTYNDEKQIEACLESVQWADEIVIIDLESNDNTVKIAKKYTDSVFSSKRVPYVELIRNYSVGKASGEWVLVLDPDEEISASLALKLKEIAKSDTDTNSFAISRKNIIFGKWMENTGWWPDYQTRFFRKGKVKWSDKIHFDPETTGGKIYLDPHPDLAIIHNNYQSVSQFLKKMDGYTNVEARGFVDNGYKFNWTDMISKPFNEFLSRFFARKGYSDGLHGLTLSCLQAFSVLVLYVKVWEINKFIEVENEEFFSKIKTEWKMMVHDFNYWLVNEELEKVKGPIKSFYYKLKKKI